MKIYCSGIGGIGLSAYAALQNANGHEVYGSDRAGSALTEDLESQGISVSTNQDGSHIPDDIDLFVYSEAIPDTAPERVRATELGVKQLNYFGALGELSKEYTVIAVCGTHGKSSTTAMAATVLLEAGLDPTVVVGTKVPQLHGRNWRKGNSDVFLLEACEYRGSFLNLHPDVVLMLNVDGDHFDAFDSVEHYQDTYREFLGRLPDNGVLITHMNNEDCRTVSADVSQVIIDADANPLPELTVPGKHMQQNAQLIIALAEHLQIENVEGHLKKFTGTWRRMELKGEYSIPNTQYSIPIIDDYAHHPLEISASIEGIREKYPDSRLVCLYQPHTHNRTLRFYDDFTKCFTGADLVVVTDVYDARPDREDGRVDVEKFVEDIVADTVYGGSVSEAKDKLCCSILQQGDVLLVMGAGDVTTVAEQLTA